jgi:DUF4097 and DUF4098 domain-containing protein YvlB
VTNGRHRRSSIFTGLLLVLLGVIFFAERLDPALGIGHLIRLLWPVLLILWGVAKLVDYLAAERDGQARGSFLSAGEAVLLVLIVLVLGGFVFRDWIRDHYPDIGVRMPPFHDSYSQTRQLTPQTIPVGARVVIEIDRGDISLRGVNGNDLGASVRQSAWGRSESVARQSIGDVDLVIEQQGGAYLIHRSQRAGPRMRVSSDLDVQVPSTSSVVAHTAHGDIHAFGIGANLEVRTEGGDVEVHDAGANVAITMQHGDARITRVRGSVRVSGGGGDVEISDVAGDATVDGIFPGCGTVRNVKGTTRCTSPWWEVSVGQLTGSLEGDTGDIKISGAAGDVRIATHNKDLELDDVSGRLDLTNVHGDVSVHYSAPPRADVNIANDSGDVELTLPGNSRFVVSAVSRAGEVQSDFTAPSLQNTSDEGSGRLTGEFGGKSATPAPRITVATSYGTVHLRRSGN